MCRKDQMWRFVRGCLLTGLLGTVFMAAGLGASMASAGNPHPKRPLAKTQQSPPPAPRPTLEGYSPELDEEQLSQLTAQNPCHAGTRADRTCTPGQAWEIDPNSGEELTADTVCTPGYAHSHRHVGPGKKRFVYARYGISYPIAPGSYDIDHLIPLKLGGSNDVSNLWPEPNPHSGDAQEKYQEEQTLIQNVCAAKMTLKEAQIQIAAHWSQIYSAQATKMQTTLSDMFVAASPLSD